MNTKSSIVIIGAAALLALASATAQTVSTSPGDVILGLRVTGGMGAGTDYEVDLGSYSNFVNQSGVIDLSSDLNASTLSSVYGTNWDTRTDLLWSVFAANNTNTTLSGGLQNRTLFGTYQSNGSPGLSNVGGAPYQSDISGNQAQAASNIAGVQTTLNGQTSVGGTGATIASGTTGAYTKNGVTGHSVMFSFSNNSGVGSPGLGGLFENSSNVLNGVNTSDFYEFVPASGNPDAALLGYFSFSSTGSGNETFEFNGSSVPEPSTYATGALAAVAITVSILRRRKVQAAA